MEALFMLMALIHALAYFLPAAAAEIGWESDRTDLALALCWYLAAENLTIRSRLKKMEFLYGKPPEKNARHDLQPPDSH